jgi:hypothetical protein
MSQSSFHVYNPKFEVKPTFEPGSLYPKSDVIPLSYPARVTLCEVVFIDQFLDIIMTAFSLSWPCWERLGSLTLHLRS